MFTSRHHWDDNKLFIITRELLEIHFDFGQATPYETWAMVLLLNSRKANHDRCPELRRTLGTEGLMIFRDIFANNNRAMVDKFFAAPLIRKLWPYLETNLTEHHCFKGATVLESRERSYSMITEALTTRYKLPAPVWWQRKFPSDI